MGKFKFNRTSWFTGRNGLFKSIGIDIWKASNNTVVISPITSKELTGRCDIAIPKESIPELINLLNDVYSKINSLNDVYSKK